MQKITIIIFVGAIVLSLVPSACAEGGYSFLGM